MDTDQADTIWKSSNNVTRENTVSGFGGWSVNVTRRSIYANKYIANWQSIVQIRLSLVEKENL